MELIKKQIIVKLDCEHIKDSPVFGEITPEMIVERLTEQLKLMLVETDIHPSEGDIFKLSNPSVSIEAAELNQDDMIPTDDESILAYLKSQGMDESQLSYERYCRELENEGMTRSDAQSVADSLFADM